jgi:hypothetical protein
VSDARDQGAESETEVIPAVGSGADIVRTKELPVVADETVVAPPPVADETVVAPPPVADETVVAPPPVSAPSSPAPEPAPPQSRPAPAPAPPRAPVPVPVPLPTPVPAPASATPAAAAPAPGGPAPAPAVAAQQSQAPAGRPPAAPSPPPPAARGGRGTAWRNAFLALVAVLVLAVVAGGVVVARYRLSTPTAARGGSGAAVAASATITSFDPSGGSGFRKESGSTWRTQTYQSAVFGNLKDGVGLLLDLGSARQVATVTFEVVGGPIAVELRAADERAASAGGYQTVAKADSASGPTTLTPKGAGKHRYWLVWVTRLGSQDGGYRAVISNPAVTAPPS